MYFIYADIYIYIFRGGGGTLTRFGLGMYICFVKAKKGVLWPEKNVPCHIVPLQR